MILHDKARPKKADLPALSEEGKKVIELIKAKTPVTFITGRAGTGKSTLIEHIKNIHRKGTVVVAPTGIAALNVEGQTIHGFFRLPARMLSIEDIAKQTCPNKGIFKNLKVIIIDEISMVRADMLDVIDQLLRLWRKSDQPFGGVQMIFVGDCLQLPPVVNHTDADIYYERYSSPWFFYAEAMKTTDVEVVELTKTYRQNDPIFVDALNRIRENNDHRDSVALLNRQCFRDVGDFKADLVLCVTNKKADAINEQKIKAIDLKPRTYTGKTTGNFNAKGRLPAPLTLSLKVGAQVMVTKNIGEAVNGSVGVVTKMSSDSVRVKLNSTGKTIEVERETWEKHKYIVSDGGIKSVSDGDFSQIPLTLAWAVTVHKSQGLTLDSVEVDLGKGAFVGGQTYVALSRCKSIQGLKLTRPISMKDVVADREILDFYNNVRKAA